MIYHDNFGYNPFIITQIHEKQNEFILTPENLIREKDEFSRFIYTQIEINKIKDTFLRIFCYKKSVVLCYYWSTNILEEKTNRSGLYVICGLIIDKKLFYSDIHLLAYYFYQFITLLSKETDSDINYYCSDNCFNELQKNTEQIINSIILSYSSLITSSNNERRNNIRHNRISKLTNSIIIIPIIDSFFNRIKIFIYESHIIYRKNVKYFDVSTNSKISHFHVKFIRNGDLIPIEINEVVLSKYDDLKYIKAIY